MKYRTFRNIVVGCVLVGGGALVALGVRKNDDAAGPHPVAAEPTAPALPAVPEATPPATDDGTGLRPLDRAALALLARPVNDSKIKDGTRGQPYKINVYSDDGKRWNRLKVDLDRDERWDEAWTIRAGGAIERRAPAEGPNPRVYVLQNGTAWKQKSAR